MSVFDDEVSQLTIFLERVIELNARYRAGQLQAYVPEGLSDSERRLDELVEELLPASHAALSEASRSLFYSLPVAFDPAESVGPYLAVVDRDASGRPYRFLDMGAQIATSAFGENDPVVVRAILESLPFVTSRYAHSEYQTTLSLRLKAELNRIAPAGTPRHFVVNTGAEAVENAIKSVLLNRVKTSDDGDGGFIVSFEGAFHGRTLGSLAVTQRRKARLGFPTFDWPHIAFPFEEEGAPKATARREERSLKQLWDLLVSGRLPRAEKPIDSYKREMDALDEFLARPDQDLKAFVDGQRAHLAPDVVRRSRRVAAVLVEPIQGEGGVRRASARFMRKLRLLTKIYDVPLIFDEVQTGWGMTGRLWAHEIFDLPCPPDVVTWAKKAQNGVLFVSEELATFFQEEKKFNTTWEGDSVGMVRLLALLNKLDLDQVQRTGERAKHGLEALARDYREILKNVRGAGVMLAFDVQRADWRDALRDRAFRRGLVLLPAGERVLRFYPRYDTEPSAIDEALAILRLAIEDLVGGRVASEPATAVEMRVGTLAIPLDTLEVVELTRANLRDSQAADSRRGTGALRGDGEISTGCVARRATTAAAVSTRNARNNRVERSCDRDRAARPCLVAVRRLRPRQLARGPRRGGRPRRSSFRREQYVLPAGDGHVANCAKRHRARELPARFTANARDRGRVRVPLDPDRGAAARHQSVMVPRRRVS